MWVWHFWLLFFFKQKTAYELRISDWSSDVCSSDLNPLWADHGQLPPRRRNSFRGAICARLSQCRGIRDGAARGRRADARQAGERTQRRTDARRAVRDHARFRHADAAAPAARSEEHTSELQSLLRISYAVFCLTNNKLLTTM